MPSNEKDELSVDPEKSGFTDDDHVPNKILKHSHDADEALKALQGGDGRPLVLDEATNKRILRKIDFNLLPVS